MKDEMVEELLTVAREVINGEIDCSTPVYRALDFLESAMRKHLSGGHDRLIKALNERPEPVRPYGAKRPEVMTRTSLFLAQGIGDSPVTPLNVVGTEMMPTLASLSEARQVYQREAKALADALQNSLPGGTMHALLVELLTRKASLLVVRDREES